MQRQPRVSRRAWVPLTGLAAALAVILFGALLVFLSARDREQEPTQVAMLSIVTVTREQRPPATEKPVVTRAAADSDLGILPLATVTPQPTHPASSTPAASTTPPPGPQATSATDINDTALMPGTCAVSTIGGATVPLYRYPDVTSDPVGQITADQSLVTYVRSENGWYEIIEIGPGILGWAPGSSLTLTGGCADLPLPTATIGAQECVGFIAGDRVELRGGPGDSFSVIDAVTLGDRVDVIAQSDNGWYRITHQVAPSVFLGWIPMTTITISGACGALPIVASAGYDPQFPETPVPTSTYTPTPERGQITGFVTSANTVARGGSIDVSWNTANTTQVYVEYYGVDLQTNQASSGPLGGLSDPATSGQWTVTVPADFAYSGIRFVIIVDNYDNGLGIPRAEVVVAVQ